MSSYYQEYSQTSLTREYRQWENKAVDEVSYTGDLRFKSEWWTHSRRIVTAAICANPLALREATPFQCDKEIVSLAISINGLALAWASTDFQDDPEMKSIAAKNLPNELPIGRYIRSNNWVDNRLFFGPNSINSFFNKLPESYNKMIQTELVEKSRSKFIRDSSVVLFGQTRLIPYTFQGANYKTLIKASLPYYPYGGIFSGKGYFQANVEQAMIHAIDYNIPFKRGKTCLEGGNCFLFYFEGKKKAIIGEMSLYLSLVALEEQNFFDDLLDTVKVENPSEEAFQVVRNRDSLEKDEITQEKEILEQAKIIEKKHILTKGQISKELGLPLDSIAFLPQSRFHIDMEMFVTPEGEAVLNSKEKTREFLEELHQSEKLSSEESSLLASYQEKVKEDDALAEKQKQVLDRTGIKFSELPAVFIAPSTELNYCNGVFCQNGRDIKVISKEGAQSGKMMEKGFTYLTTGPTLEEEKIFHSKFSKLFKRTFPDYTLHGVQDMSQFIANYSGGIHCLTLEGSLITEKI